MKIKFILVIAIIFVLLRNANAQCPQPPLYLSATGFNDSSTVFTFTIPQPSCDSILGWQMEWRIQGSSSSWSSDRFDSLKQVGGAGLWGGRFGGHFTLGQKYQCRVRMIMYKPNGKPVYSSWAIGNSFVPSDPPDTGYSTTPTFLEMFLPSSSSIGMIIGDEPMAHWYIPKKYQIEYRVSGTTGWPSSITAKTPKPYGAFFASISSLAPSTLYNWRIRFLCGSGHNSKWIAGPDFTTAATGFEASSQQLIIRRILNFKSSDVTQEADDSNSATLLSKAKNIVRETIVYPNPASSQLHIVLSNADNKSEGKVLLVLKDINGKTVWSGENTNAGTTMNVDVSKLPNGIYILQIINSKNIISAKKIIISR